MSETRERDIHLGECLETLIVTSLADGSWMAKVIGDARGVGKSTVGTGEGASPREAVNNALDVAEGWTRFSLGPKREVSMTDMMRANLQQTIESIVYEAIIGANDAEDAREAAKYILDAIREALLSERAVEAAAKHEYYAETALRFAILAHSPDAEYPGVPYMRRSERR